MQAPQAAEQIGATTQHLHSMTVEDPADQAAMQPWVPMECYQLGQGRRLAQIDSLDLGPLQIVRERQATAVQKLGVTPADVCTLSYCTPDPKFRFSELRAEARDTVFFMPAGTEFDLYVPAGTETAYVSFSQQEFLAVARTLDPATWETAPRHVQSIRGARQSVFRGEVERRLRMPDAPVVAASLRTRLLHDVLQATGGTAADASPVERAHAFHTCRKAKEFVEACLTNDVTPNVVELCAALGVSERALQYAFRAYVDMSPLAYLRLCRLNRVRAVLRAAEPHSTRVTDIAMRFGFLHLGRFAQEYRRLFAESPSATLAA